MEVQREEGRREKQNGGSWSGGRRGEREREKEWGEEGGGRGREGYTYRAIAMELRRLTIFPLEPVNPVKPVGPGSPVGP